MNNRVNAFAIAALCAAFTASHAGAVLVASKVSQVDRPTTSVAVEVSGITYAGGNLYYAVDDADKKLYPLTIVVSSSGSISSSSITIGTGVSLENASDLEGCAFDPATGNVWVSDETGSKIREYSPSTGKLLRTAPVPTIFSSSCLRNDRSFESLTISGDGKTMWTANEEALTCDGLNATASNGTVVRLLKFTRKSVRDNWTAVAQYAYLTDTMASDSGVDQRRCGVSGLVALPNGGLLVLEREVSGYRFRVGLYEVNFTDADDVSTLPSLDNADYVTKVGKRLTTGTLFTTGFANYEGICLGPRLDDNSATLVLISDGGGNSLVEKEVMTMKLTGIDVRTLYVEGDANSEPVGGPYRHVGGTTVSASLSGVGNPYEANLCVHPSWTATANNARGDGSYASFAISADDTLRWSTATNTSLPLVAADSFERIPVATEADGLDGWNGEGWVVATNYTPALPPGYPLTNEVHTQVLMVDGDVERTYDTSIARGVVLDTMVCATLPSVDSPIVDVEDGVVAFHFDEDGYPILQHSSADGLTHMRTRLCNQKFANGNWLRLTLTLSNVGTQTWCQVRINGSTCVSANAYRSPADTAMVGTYGSWFRAIADKDPAEISSLLLKGTGAVDDVALYTASGLPEFDNNGNATTNSVSYQWLYDNGLPFDTELDVDGDGFKSSQEWRNGTNPTDPWNKSDNPRSRKITVFTIQ